MLVSFMYALTSPVIHIYFIKQIGPDILAITNMLSVGLAAVVNSTVPNDKIKELYRRNFITIVVVDVLCFCAFSILGMEYAAIRFIGFAVLDAVSTNLWVVIIKNSINRCISGDKLTDWDALSKSCALYAGFVGGIIAFLCSDMFTDYIELCILGQCICNLTMGITDIKAFKRLERLKISKKVD